MLTIALSVFGACVAYLATVAIYRKYFKKEKPEPVANSVVIAPKAPEQPTLTIEPAPSPTVNAFEKIKISGDAVITATVATPTPTLKSKKQTKGRGTRKVTEKPQVIEVSLVSRSNTANSVSSTSTYTSDPVMDIATGVIIGNAMQTPRSYETPQETVKDAPSSSSYDSSSSSYDSSSSYSSSYDSGSSSSDSGGGGGD